MPRKWTTSLKVFAVFWALLDRLNGAGGAKGDTKGKSKGQSKEGKGASECQLPNKGGRPMSTLGQCSFVVSLRLYILQLCRFGSPSSTLCVELRKWCKLHSCGAIIWFAQAICCTYFQRTHSAKTKPTRCCITTRHVATSKMASDYGKIG